MKYVMFKCESDGKPSLLLPVIFPDVITHKDMAEAIGHTRVMPEGPFAGWWMWPKPMSAGFYDNGVCHGYSESLKLKSRQEDTAVIKSFIANGCIEIPA